MNTKMLALFLLTEMQSKDITYDELSVKTGIPKSSLQRYLTAEREIPIDRYESICAALGLNPAETLGWKEEQPDDFSREILDIFSRMSPHSKSLALEVLKRFADQ